MFFLRAIVFRVYSRCWWYSLGSVRLDLSGRAASAGALAPKPPRATRFQPRSIRILVFPLGRLNSIFPNKKSSRDESTRFLGKSIPVMPVVVVVVSLLIQLNPRAQNISRPWREPHRRYKSELRSTKHESPHRTIEAPRSRGGGQYECRFHVSQNHKDPGRGKITRAPPSWFLDLNFFLLILFEVLRITRWVAATGLLT